MTMTRMNLDQLVAYFNSENLTQTACYFKGCANDSVTKDGLIELDFVKRHVGEGDLWREIQSNVTTYIGCKINTLTSTSRTRRVRSKQGLRLYRFNNPLTPSLK